MTKVELRFPVTGMTVPADHGYLLYAALSRLLPEVHGADWLALKTLPGFVRGDGLTQLATRSTLSVRLPQERLPLLLKLAGKRLDVGGHALRLGAPQIFLLRPSPQLYARLVTIKGFTEPEPFLASVCRKLGLLGVRGRPLVGPRRVVRISSHTVVGFALTVCELSAEDSLRLQADGLGGRRRMGGGFFTPISERGER